MRMGVDEARKDHGVLEPLAGSELRSRSDRGDPATVERDGAVLDRRPAHREHPVGAQDSHASVESNGGSESLVQ